MTAMIRRFLLPASVVIFGCFVLFISITNASEIDISVSDLSQPLPAGPNIAEQYYVNYELPEASSSPIPIFARISAVGDKIQLATSLTPLAKAQAMVDDANKRIVAGEALIRDGKIKEGLASVNKAQEYLNNAFEITTKQDGYRANVLLQEISIASLKHRERLESLLVIVPDETRTLIVSNLDRAKLVYNQTKIALQMVGENPPQNPFE